MARRTVSAAAFRRLVTADIVVLIAIVVSGAIVRLTDSGLGCANWPSCSDTKFVDVSSGHSAIEQINRIFSGLIVIPLAATVFAAYRREQRRNDLVRLSWLLLVVFFGEAVLGGISVMVELAWFSVMAHFLLAITLLGIALVLRQRAAEPEGERRPVVARSVEVLAWIVYLGTIWVLVWGTLVTASGPHGGDEEARRLAVSPSDVARMHSVSVDVLVGIVVALIVMLMRTHAPRRVTRVASLTVVVMAGQGVLGYVQYFNDIPPLLVGFHVFGATLTFVCVQQLVLELRRSQPRTDLNRMDLESRAVMSRA
jgi:cytochrome c oxidase assembly protein subunit 15